MEVDDASVERQKLVMVDPEENAKSEVPTNASPVLPKISIRNMSSGPVSSRNSSDQTNARVTYVNEKRSSRPQDERFEFKSRKLLKEFNDADNVSSVHSLNSIVQIGSSNSLNHLESSNKNMIKKRTTPLVQRKASNASHSAVSPLTLYHNNNTLPSDKFDDRPIKHHSFVSEVPDVKHMERALLGLLDDFHSGKLKAFGSGCTMDQMTKIREQQESLAKLHFELAAAEEDKDLNAVKAQDNMVQLVQRLEMLSISIEQLQTSHTAI